MRYFLIFYFAVFNLYARNDRSSNLSFGSVVIGEERIPIDLTHFELFSKKTDSLIEAQFVPKSVQWIRTNNVLLLPRAAVKITTNIPAQKVHVSYHNDIILMQENAENISETEMFVSLFDATPIKVFVEGKLYTEIQLKSKKVESTKENILIDYSCAPYNLEVKGLDNYFASIGCNLLRHGKMGSEYGVLEIYWAASNLTLLDGTPSPFAGIVKENYPLKINLKNTEGEIRLVEIKANVPKRLYRYKTAIGFGPYNFKTQEDPGQTKEVLTPSYMAYANLYLSDKTSLRAFDALLWQKSFFNNLGLYYANELALVMDNRIQVTTLLGAQAVSYYYNQSKETLHQIIYPQGFEVSYLHAFNMKNWNLTYGMFIYPFRTQSYQNIWIRHGTRWFWELNYLSWQNAEKKTYMYGLSIGIPFISMF